MSPLAETVKDKLVNIIPIPRIDLNQIHEDDRVTRSDAELSELQYAIRHPTDVLAVITAKLVVRMKITSEEVPPGWPIHPDDLSDMTVLQAVAFIDSSRQGQKTR